LESDKAAMEIPASAIGKVISIEVSVGDTVNSGLPFLQIEVSDDAAEKDEKVPPKNTDKKNHTVNEESENIKSEQLANLKNQKILLILQIQIMQISMQDLRLESSQENLELNYHKFNQQAPRIEYKKKIYIYL